MVVQSLSKKAFTLLALQLAGYGIEFIGKTCKETNNNRLKDFCFVSAKTLRDIFQDIQHPSLNELQIKNPDSSHLIYALYFLKKYPTAHELAARCTDGTEKTVLKRAWRYIRAIQGLKEKKIQWIFDDNNHDEFFILSVTTRRSSSYKRDVSYITITENLQ